jgi:hypothetical protein
VSGEGGKLRLQVTVATGGASHGVAVAHQLLKFRSTVFAEIFVYRHVFVL